METKKTQRGFKISSFKDSLGNECSLQKSSSMEPKIWLGINNPRLVVFQNETKGKYIETDMPKTFSVNARMHLTKEQVKELIPYLQKFADSGEL